MSSTFGDKIYNLDLISEIKRKSGPEIITKIRKYLRSITEADIKDLNELKIKIFDDTEEKKIIEEEKKEEFKIVAPTVNVQLYLNDFKKLNSKSNLNEEDDKGENTPSTVVDDGEVEQADSSDFSDDE